MGVVSGACVVANAVVDGEVDDAAGSVGPDESELLELVDASAGAPLSEFDSS